MDGEAPVQVGAESGPATRAQADQLKARPEIREALQQTATSKEPQGRVVESKDKAWLGIYAFTLLVLGILYYTLRLNLLGIPLRFLALSLRLTLGVMVGTLVLGLAKLVEATLIEPLADPASRFNLRRIVRLVVWLTLGLIVISVLFANWYTAVVSLGLISLILGFALQTPITSFIGWVYILVRKPYRVGDRVRIGEATGDVIDVSYLDTTLWEFGGEYLSTDHPSGRIIRFPNSLVLTSRVYNYSWPLFPYIWNEVKFHISYDSDLEFIAQTMQQAAEEELGSAMMERVQVFRELLGRTPVDHLEVRERPAVLFRINENTWLEAIVRYLVEPRQAGRVKTRLIRTMLERLNASPDRVLFPKSNLR